ncbi:MAG: nucleotidyl transferase AbiEii/AbiGii toxin family protein [Natronosporangium sp.]
MIAVKFVDLYARNSGMRDQLIAERDVVLTYALRGLYDTGVMNELAFKGGTCLRKLVFGSSGRFSEDLDFTLDTDRPDDDVLTDLVEAFNREHHGSRSPSTRTTRPMTTPPSAATFATGMPGMMPVASGSR